LALEVAEEGNARPFSLTTAGGGGGGGGGEKQRKSAAKRKSAVAKIRAAAARRYPDDPDKALALSLEMVGTDGWCPPRHPTPLNPFS